MANQTERTPASRRHNPTVAQIAKIAGVSRSTAAEALRGSPKVAPETRERVLAVARRLDYRANLAASALRSGFGPGIGVLLGPHHVSRPMSVGYFFHGWMGSFVRTTSAAGIATTFVASDDVNALAGRDIAVVVLFGPAPRVELAQELGFGIPIVHVSTRHDHNTNARFVLCHPNHQAIEQVLTHFVDRRAQRVAMVVGREPADMGHELEVFWAECDAKGLAGTVIDVSSDQTADAQITSLSAQLSGDVDAIYSRLVAPELVATAAVTRGRVIGRDLLVVCDSDKTHLTDPPLGLSNVDFLGVECGEMAATASMEILSNPHTERPGNPIIVDMPWSFVVRESSAVALPR